MFDVNADVQFKGIDNGTEVNDELNVNHQSVHDIL